MQTTRRGDVADSFQTPVDSGDGFTYIKEGMTAEGHTPIYKMHKYFARRPQNVFRNLIEAYSLPGDIVLDCFSGGGVTLFEGLSVGRRVIAVDLNPLATFISECQTTSVPINEYLEIIRRIRDQLLPLAEKYYSTSCRKCGSRVAVRWFELAYTAVCGNPNCGKTTPLSNKNRVVKDGKGVNGRYACEFCGSSFAAVDAKRNGYRLVTVTYQCKRCHGRQTVPPNSEDESIMMEMERDSESLIRSHGLTYPSDTIPIDWDRQKEDCLSRKGILKFSDFFTKRGLFFNAFLFNQFMGYRHSVSQQMNKMLMFTFSAIIRHTNNMTISVGSWMDGRPVAWAKHAFWISNQFVEVNPVEYLDKRAKAIRLGLKYQKTRLFNTREVDTFQDLLNGKGTHVIWTRSSETLPIPGESVDLVLTDPPYGSNVQYGELSSFWLVWLAEELGLGTDFLSLDKEIVVHRKKNVSKHKGYDDYYGGLLRVFSECHRVLKTGRPLVFTFNNKNIKAWYSVLKAATNAGFFLDDRGVVYQEPIEIYRNTAHARFAGALRGDFIYTFRKLPTPVTTQGIRELDGSAEIEDLILQVSQDLMRSRGKATTDQIRVATFSRLIPVFLRRAESDVDYSRFAEEFSRVHLDEILGNCYAFDPTTKAWQNHERKVPARHSIAELETFADVQEQRRQNGGR